MQAIVLVPLIILAILMAVIAGIVTYLLYRPSAKKKKLKPEGPVASQYKDPPENGDVKVIIPDDKDGTMLPPYSPERNGKDIKIDVENTDEEESEPDDKRLLEVITHPNERAVDVGELEKRAPEDSSELSASDTEKPPVDDVGKKSSSSSSSDSEPDETPRVDPDDREVEKPVPAKRSTSPVSSSSSSSDSEDEDVIPERMPVMDPHIVREAQLKKEPDMDSEKNDTDDLVSDVLAAVDQKSSKSSSSSSDEGKDEDEIIPTEEPVIEKSASPIIASSSSSSDEETLEKEPVTEEIIESQQPGYTFMRDRTPKESSESSSSSEEELDSTRKTPLRKGSQSSGDNVVVVQTVEREVPTSSSSSSEGELHIIPVAASTTTQVKSSSSSTSESDEDEPRLDVKEASTGTAPMPLALKRKKGKKYPPPTPYKPKHPASTQTKEPKTSSSSSSESDEDDRKENVELQYSGVIPSPHKRTVIGVPISTQTDTFSSSSASSSSSEIDIDSPVSPGMEISTQTMDTTSPRKKIKKRKSGRPYSYETSPTSSLRTASIASSGSEREIYRTSSLQGTPRQGPRPWSPTPGVHEVATSPQLERATQTLFAPKTKKTKKAKSKASVRPPSPVVITLTDKCIQTSKIGWTSSSSSDEEGKEKPQKPAVRYVHEKGVQMTSSSSSSEDDISIRTRREVTVTSRTRNTVSMGTSTDTLERRKVQKVTTTAYGEIQHERRTIELELEPEETYKVEALVELPPEPKKIIFTTSWGEPADLLDLYDAGIVDEETKVKLERGELEPIDDAVVRTIKPYISSNKPIAGILLDNNKKISIHEASRRGLINRMTAMNLLEAEMASGILVDPVTGRKMTIKEAEREGFIDRSYIPVLERADGAVRGFKQKESDVPISVFEAMNQGLIVHSHGIRLLEAQLATGGIIDPRANHRVPLETAYRRRLCDRQLMKSLEDKTDESKGFLDPNTQEKLTYSELKSLCITDLETGILLLPLQTRSRGRSLSPSSIRSSMRLDMKSPNRSKSAERQREISVFKSVSSSSDSESVKKEPSEIKTSSVSIELAKSPKLSTDDDEVVTKRFRSDASMEIESHDEMTSKVIETVTLHLEKDVEYKENVTSEAKIQVTSPPVFEEVEMKVDVKERRESSSSSSSDEDGQKVSVEEVTSQATQVSVVETAIDKTKESSSEDDREGERKIKTEVKREETSEYTSSTSIITTTETVISTEVITEKRRRSRHDIKFRSGWNRQASLLDLFAAGVISNETVKELEEGTIEEKDVEENLHQYLVGSEPIAGVLLSDNGEKMSIFAAWRRGLIRRGTSISLLEAQAATGRILDPNSGQRMSVAEASSQKLIDRGFEAVLSRAERAVYGYTTRLSPDVLSLFQAMKRGLVVENHGIRLLEAQIATGGIIDPNANHRLPVDVAYERGLFDQRINEILEDPSDDTRGFFDPNTEENLTYLELMERCVMDKDTGMRLLPLRSRQSSYAEKRSKVVFESRTGRQVTLRDLVHAEVLDDKTAKRFDQGEMTHEETQMMVAKLRVFVDGSMPIAGVINNTTGERMSIYEAAKSGLIRRGTAFELLEAQACCGKIIDVQNGRIITIETALRSGAIDREFKDVVERAHRAVTGYREPFKRELLSLCEAMNRHLVVRKHGIRLLEAQIATGGIVDIRSPVRINVQVALKRTLIDSKLADELEKKQTQSYFDPVTGENLNYSELMGRCVTDKDTGLLYLMVEGGTVTGYVLPFEPEHASKIRSQSASPAKIKTEEVTTKRSGTVVESTTSVRKKKKRRSKTSSRASASSASSTGEESSTSTPPSPSLISRRVIIVDPSTNEELTVQDALSRKLIDQDTARELMARQGDWEEAT